jgi:hypothetical protein
MVVSQAQVDVFGVEHRLTLLAVHYCQALT